MSSHGARVPSVNAEAPGIGESAVVGSGFPVVVLAAAVLASERVSGVLVGSAALWLRGQPVSVGDVGVVVEPEEANLRRAPRGAVRPGGLARSRPGGTPAPGDLGRDGFLLVRPGGLHAGTRPL